MSASRASVSTYREVSSPGRRSARSLALASLLACLVIGACRLLTHALAFDATVLDGVAFLAAIFWAISVVGYFVPRTVIERSPCSRATGRTHVAERRMNLEAPTAAELVA